MRVEWVDGLSPTSPPSSSSLDDQLLESDSPWLSPASRAGGGAWLELVVVEGVGSNGGRVNPLTPPSLLALGGESVSSTCGFAPRSRDPAPAPAPLPLERRLAATDEELMWEEGREEGREEEGREEGVREGDPREEVWCRLYCS